MISPKINSGRIFWYKFWGSFGLFYGENVAKQMGTIFRINLGNRRLSLSRFDFL